MAQLTCQRLCVGYDGQSVLQDLTFELLAGDYLCIVGENGSGKSTLMKTILGLQAPISGRILTGDGLRKNEIGYLPQQTVVQKDFPAAVREIVLSGCQGRCGSRPFCPLCPHCRCADRALLLPAGCDAGAEAVFLHR